MFDGMTVPVLDMDEAEDESSSYSGGSSCNGSGGGKEESLVLANSLARLDMAAWTRLYNVQKQDLSARGGPR